MLTYPITTPFDVLAEKVVERINAIGPFTVVADMRSTGKYDDHNTIKHPGDANSPAIVGIQDVTAVAITSDE